MDVTLYVLLATGYGLLGALLSSLYYLGRRLREEPAFHLLTALVIVLAILVVALAVPADFERLAAFHRGAQFLLFSTASLLYVPVVMFLILHYWDRLVGKLLSPGSTKEPPAAPRTQREHWDRIQAHLEALATNPTDPALHEALGDLYQSMGFLDSAVYQYRKAAEWADRGHAQGSLLYKAARILVEKKNDVPGALSVLRRIVRLYPRSYFAAYARRVVSRHEAHGEAEREKREKREGLLDGESYTFLPPDFLEDP